MRFPRFAFCRLLPAALAVSAALAQVTDKHVTTWLTANAGQYARVYETAAKRTSGTTVTTWPSSGLTNNGGGQSTLAYSDVQRVAYSTNYVYIYTTGFPSYTFGNWLNPQGATFTFWPKNQNAIYRIPRNPSIPTTKTTANGVGGVWLNGVHLWENGDAQSYINAATTGSTSTATSADIASGGDGVWNRLAGQAEAFNFDPAYGHQPSSGAYHTHINPIALRYQIDSAHHDNVSYNSSTKVYSEGTTSSPPGHSPLLGWALDGLPIYGPYGYGTATDATSTVRRMTSGFVKRDGTNGTVNLASTGRVTLPAWSARVQGISATLPSSKYGPSTTATYAQGSSNVTCSIGIFAEDYEYLGDLGKTQGTDFDLNEQNVRYCVTPEFPSGTYAYFVCIDSAGNTAFPDVINQQFYGSLPSGSGPNISQGTVTSITETVTEYADAGPAAPITVSGSSASGGNVLLSWNSSEGATYKVEASDDSVNYSTLSSTVTSAGLTTTYTTTTGAANNYYRVTLTAIASYDTGGTYGTAVGTTKTFLYGTAATAPTIGTQPTNQTVTVGNSVTFSVAATGTGTLSYQWKKAGVAISGQTASTYTIVSPTSADAGSYTVTVTNVIGSATSNTATLTVNPASVAPTITTQPTDATVSAGNGASFTVVASGTPAPTYQWSKSGVAIGGATNATYAIASVQASDAGSYTVAVVNSAGSVTSNAAALTVTAAATPPSITTQPAGASITAGSSASFSVVATGTAPLSYQWSKNGTAISGATSATYSIASAQTSDAGSYTVTIANSGGSATSNAATLSVAAAPVAPAITTQPASASVNPGSGVTFTVVASGTPAPTYQWSKNGAAITGATGASYAIASVAAADAGSYTVAATNSAGSVTSSAATLTVTAAVVAPTIGTQPTSASVTAGNSASFTVVANGTAPLSYQWSKGGAAISGATSATYTIASAQSADAANYTVTVTNSAGSITSSAAQLTVSAAPVVPTITTQPLGSSLTAGGNVTFTVVASGTAPLTYQWYKGSAPIAGATTATYSITSAQVSDAGNYTVVVSNSAGNVTSSVAALAVTAPASAPTITVQPATTAASVLTSATFSVVATGSPAPTYQWQKNGSAIFGATSASLTLTTVTQADAATYTVVVTNASGSVTSNGATLTVSVSAVAPTIATQPVAVTVNAGASATFSVVANGTAPISYQWMKNGTAVSGATSATFTIASPQTSDAGNYTCIVGNSVGIATSAAAALTVNPAVAPAIVTSPVSATVASGGSATFVVVASGTAPLTYQWYLGANAISGATGASYSIASAQAADAGDYTVAATNTAGSATSSIATLTVNTSSNTVAPAITMQPASATVTAGAGAVFSIVASGTAPLTYQWSKNGTAISGATGATFTIATAQVADAGNYTVTVTNSAGSVTSTIAALAVNSPPPVVPTLAAGITNLSVRTRLGGTAGTPIIGFVLGGTGQGKKLLVRAVGPTLIASFGVTGALSDPALQLLSGSRIVQTNDNWSAIYADTMAAVGAFPLNPGSGDAAIVTPLAPGAYTALVTAPAGQSGLVLVETYDAAPADTTARLVNASARAFVGTGDDVLIPGFTIAGTGTVKVLLRAIGPGLAQFGLPGTLTDPQLALYSGATVVASNDNWGDGGNAAAIASAAAQVGAFTLPAGSKDAVLLVSLPAGSYSAVINGTAGGTGLALVELYVVQ